VSEDIQRHRMAGQVTENPSSDDFSKQVDVARGGRQREIETSRMVASLQSKGRPGGAPRR
jgi:hypothetical protein